MGIISKDEFAGRTAIVTGGGRGLGAAVCRLLWEHGCRSIYSLSATGTAKETNDNVTYIKADVSDCRQVEAAVKKVLSDTGRIDILVNCAGICIKKDFLDITEDDYDWVMDINLRGTFLCCQKVMPSMIKHGYGRIVNISSTAGITGGSVGQIYGMSKAGIIALSQSLGRTFARNGILTNCVAPGEIDTDLLDQVFETEEIRQKRIENIPVGHIASPDEVASIVIYLLSDAAGYITGETYRVSGGRV